MTNNACGLDCRFGRDHGPVYLDLRFPGQWFQLETGLHYNWHRHYDPSTGRYTTPDPLGLHQDPQPRANAWSSPQESFDAWLDGLGLNAGPVQDDGRRVVRDGPGLYAYVGFGFQRHARGRKLAKASVG